MLAKREAGLRLLRGRTFPDAEADCVSMGGHLPSVHNAFQNALLVSLGQSYLNYEQIWIGLRKANYINWQWSDGTVIDYTKWLHDDNQQSITYLDPTNNGYWQSLPWTDFSLKPYFCEIPLGNPVFINSTSSTTRTTTTKSTTTATTRPPWEKCPTNFIYFATTHACYYVNPYDPNYYINYDQATKVCADLGTTLASIHSIEENEFIQGLVPNVQFCTYATLGGYSIDNNANYKWQDTTPFDFENWYYKVKYPNYNNAMRVGNCGTIGSPGKWDTVSRLQGYYFYVCKYHVN